MDTCTVMQYFIRLDSKIKLFTEICQKKHLNVAEIQQPFVVLVTQVTQDLLSYVKLWGKVFRPCHVSTMKIPLQ